MIIICYVYDGMESTIPKNEQNEEILYHGTIEFISHVFYHTKWSKWRELRALRVRTCERGPIVMAMTATTTIIANGMVGHTHTKANHQTITTTIVHVPT